MSELCLVINTCKGYFKNINGLINQINKIDSEKIFPRENILIVSGQEDKEDVVYRHEIKIVKVTYTGLHLTSSIYVYENIDLLKSKFKYFLLLPDTVKFGNNFFTKIVKLYEENIKNSDALSLPLLNWTVRPTMDMGILHYNYIINIRDYLNKIKKCKPYDMDILKTLKKQLIYNENIIFGLPSYFTKDKVTQFNYEFDFDMTKRVSPIINNKNDIVEKRIIKNDRTLNRVYFKPLDLYKFQRNFSLEGELVLEL
jgi:hypothetical protein